MCGCEHHHDTNAPCTCRCPDHAGVRREMERREQRITDSGRLREVVAIRSEYVNRFVMRRIDHRDGDCDNAEIEKWENQAFEMWRNQYPALNSMLPSHLPEGATS